MIRVFFMCFLFFGFVEFSSLDPFEKSDTKIRGIVYYQLDDFHTCIRRLNATHQTGCSSFRTGNSGTVQHLEKQEDIEWMINSSPRDSYIGVLPAKLFQRDNIDRLIESAKVKGLIVLVVNETDYPDAFSPDLSCPNDHYGLYSSDGNFGNCKKLKWNLYGSGLMFKDIPFPIVAILNSTYAEFIIHNCYEKFNQKQDSFDAPVCGIEIKDVMDAAKDTPTCLRRNSLSLSLTPQFYCAPLGNFNVYAYFDSLSNVKVLEKGSVTMISARLDSFSLFDSQYPGYESAVVSFVTLHAIAEALGKMRNQLMNTIQSYPLMFTLLHGEAFDYIGSSRMVYNMEKGEFLPVTMETIGTIIEIGQVGPNDEPFTLWLHTDPVTINKSSAVQNRVNVVAGLMTSIGTEVGVNVKRPAEGSPLPPSSLHQFLKSSESSIAGILLASHEKEFTNRYYNSMFDNGNISGSVTQVADHIQKVATTVARAVFSLLLPNSLEHRNVVASNVTVANLLFCFAQNPDCELFNSTIEFGKADALVKLKRAYLSRYVSVSMNNPTFVVSQHQFLLAHFLGRTVENALDASACYSYQHEKNGYNYFYMQGPMNEADETRKPVCVEAAAFMSKAISPAFTISDYNWSSELYSSWTESYWNENGISVLIFLQPSQKQEVITLCLGLAIFVVFLAAVYVIEKKSLILFKSGS